MCTGVKKCRLNRFFGRPTTSLARTPCWKGRLNMPSHLPRSGRGCLSIFSLWLHKIHLHISRLSLCLFVSFIQPTNAQLRCNQILAQLVTSEVYVVHPLFFVFNVLMLLGDWLQVRHPVGPLPSRLRRQKALEGKKGEIHGSRPSLGPLRGLSGGFRCRGCTTSNGSPSVRFREVGLRVALSRVVGCAS